MSRSDTTALAGALATFRDTFDEDSLIEVRDFLMSLSESDDARLRDASRYWMAAFGALLEAEDLQSLRSASPREAKPVGAEVASEGPTPEELFELFLRGAERWLEFCDADLEVVPAVARPHHGLAQAQRRPVKPLREAVTAFRTMWSGGPGDPNEVLRGLTEALAIVFARASDPSERGV
jgi:hypothetical protein